MLISLKTFSTLSSLISTYFSEEKNPQTLNEITTENYCFEGLCPDASHPNTSPKSLFLEIVFDGVNFFEKLSTIKT